MVVIHVKSLGFPASPVTAYGGFPNFQEFFGGELVLGLKCFVVFAKSGGDRSPATVFHVANVFAFSVFSVIPDWSKISAVAQLIIVTMAQSTGFIWILTTLKRTGRIGLNVTPFWCGRSPNPDTSSVIPANPFRLRSLMASFEQTHLSYLGANYSSVWIYPPVLELVMWLTKRPSYPRSGFLLAVWYRALLMLLIVDPLLRPPLSLLFVVSRAQSFCPRGRIAVQKITSSHVSIIAGLPLRSLGVLRYTQVARDGRGPFQLAQSERFVNPRYHIVISRPARPRAYTPRRMAPAPPLALHAPRVTRPTAHVLARTPQ